MTSPTPTPTTHHEHDGIDEQVDSDSEGSTYSQLVNDGSGTIRYFYRGTNIEKIFPADKKPSDMKTTITEFTRRSLIFLRGLGLGWSLLILDILFGIPLSLLLTHLNKKVISYIGYEKIMRCPSGIMGSRIFFIVINILLVVNWGIQLNEEAKMEGEIKHWDGVVEFLEGEKEHVEGLIGEEVEEQLVLEASREWSEDGKGGVSGKGGSMEEEMIPDVPSTGERRVIRPAASAGMGAVERNRQLAAAYASVEMRKTVIEPGSLREVKKSAPGKMTVGRKAGLRMRLNAGRVGADEEDIAVEMD